MTKNYWTDRDAVYDQTAVCCNYMNVFLNCRSSEIKLRVQREGDKQPAYTPVRNMAFLHFSLDVWLLFLS